MPIIPAIEGIRNFIGIPGDVETRTMKNWMTNLINDKVSNSGNLTGVVDYLDYGSKTASQPSGDWTGGKLGPQFAYGNTLGKSDYSIDPYTGKVNFDRSGTAYDFEPGALGSWGYIPDFIPRGIEKTVNRGGLFNMIGGQPQHYTPDINIPLNNPTLSNYRGNAAVYHDGMGMDIDRDITGDKSGIYSSLWEEFKDTSLDPRDNSLLQNSSLLGGSALAAEAADIARFAATGKGQSWVPNRLYKAVTGNPGSTLTWAKSGGTPAARAVLNSFTKTNPYIFGASLFLPKNLADGTLGYNSDTAMPPGVSDYLRDVYQSEGQHVNPWNPFTQKNTNLFNSSTLTGSEDLVREVVEANHQAKVAQMGSGLTGLNPMHTSGPTTVIKKAPVPTDIWNTVPATHAAVVNAGGGMNIPPPPPVHIPNIPEQIWQAPASSSSSSSSGSSGSSGGGFSDGNIWI